VLQVFLDNRHNTIDPNLVILLEPACHFVTESECKKRKRDKNDDAKRQKQTGAQ
jgi:hypothetical protein